MPAFSIITPSLNQGRYLAECLDSVRTAAARAGVEVEHIVVDGGSTDETLAILQSAAGVVWKSGPDGGQTEAINKGLAMSSGGILSYLCADDMLEHNALQLVRDAFLADASADFVYGDAFFLEAGWKRRKTAGTYSYARLRRGNFLFQPSVFWRRRVYEQCGGFDASLRYCMDHEYWLRAGGGFRWTRVDEPLASCRLHANAKTWSQLVPAWDEARVMQARHGIRWRPLRDAIWMRLFGAHFYRLRRSVYAALSRGRKR